MKKALQRFFEKRRNRTIVYLLLGISAFILIYLFLSIRANLKEMQRAAYHTAVYFPTYPTINLKGKTPDEIAKIRQGEYLVKAGDCIACHTNTDFKGPAFAGGLSMPTPFGIIYTPNITTDKETGIGTWTEKQFIKAMREGISPQGYYYYPAFPYFYFSKVTDDDLRAIKAYLDNLPPIRLENRNNKMVWPFNWRFMQFGWRLLFFNASEKAVFKPDPQKSPAWNRGAYLIEGLGHCAMCHTPSYYLIDKSLSLGAPIRKYNLTGAIVQGYLAPNITKSNIGGISDEDLLKVFTNYHMIGGAPVQGPMLAAIHDSLMHLTRQDLLAMIAYLKSVESQIPPQSMVGASGEGESIYNSYCSGCHSLGVSTAPQIGNALSWGPLYGSGIEKLYAVAIQGGGNMPARGTCLHCSDLQIKRAVDYIVAVTLEANQKNKHPKQLIAVDGEHVYNQYCSSCHNAGKNGAPKLGDIEAFKPIIAAGFLKTYQNILLGRKGHPLHGGCNCSDAELLSALKYLLYKSSTNSNYILW